MKDLTFIDLQKLQLHDIKISRTKWEDEVTWIKKINDYEESVFFKKLEKLGKELVAEINYNRELGVKKEFEEYLLSIKEAMDHIIFGLKSNIQESDLIRRISEEVYELQGQLIMIPEYKAIQIKGQKSPSGNQKIDWKEQVNQLVDLHIWMAEQGHIDLDLNKASDKEILVTFLLNNYTWKGKPLSESSMKTIIDPNRAFDKRPKEKKQIRPKTY